MTIASRGTGVASKDQDPSVVDASELFEDEDVDTGVLRIRYEKSMERLAAKRVDLAKLKLNIPLPDKP